MKEEDEDVGQLEWKRNWNGRGIEYVGQLE